MRETLEEASENNYPDGDDLTIAQAVIRRLAFKKGAKWQQEQDNKLYSEKEVRDLFNLYKEEFSIYRNSQILNVQFEEWFNENKKQQ
jgi:hypothetical protein